jgi:hypothetical protein
MVNSIPIQKKRGRKKKVIKVGRTKGKGKRISAFITDMKKYSRLRHGILIAEIPETPVMPPWYQGRRVEYIGDGGDGLILYSDIDYLELHMVLRGFFGEDMLVGEVTDPPRGVFSLETYHSMV